MSGGIDGGGIGKSVGIALDAAGMLVRLVGAAVGAVVAVGNTVGAAVGAIEIAVGEAVGVAVCVGATVGVAEGAIEIAVGEAVGVAVCVGATVGVDEGAIVRGGEAASTVGNTSLYKSVQRLGCDPDPVSSGVSSLIANKSILSIQKPRPTNLQKLTCSRFQQKYVATDQNCSCHFWGLLSAVVF